MKCCACGQECDGRFMLYVPNLHKDGKGKTKPICRSCRMKLSRPWQTQADIINRQNNQGGRMK